VIRFRPLVSLFLLSLICFTQMAKAADGQDDAPVQDFVRDRGPIRWTGQFKFDEAPELRQKVGLPIYRWTPVGQEPRAIALAIHGLTLHGQCYEVLAKGFAAGGFLFVAPDMRGYGANAKSDDPALRKINNERSYQDIVKLAQVLNDQYPNLPIAAVGESLGTSFCVRLAAEHHDLVDGIIIAAPTSRVNPLMFFAPQTIAEGLKALVTPRHEMSYRVFFDKLVSNNEAIIKELQEDPMTLKQIPLGALLETTAFVKKTNKWARSIRRDEPVLILQGSKDQAMVPRAVTRLTKNIRSTDQTIRWISGYGHLLLETDYIGPPALDAITSFIDDHDDEERAIRAELYREMKRFGAKDLPVND
jgi:alpha-beta hydrolase superfamily lysophospholipase